MRTSEAAANAEQRYGIALCADLAEWRVMAFSLYTGHLTTHDRDHRAYGRLVINVTPGFASVRFLREGVEVQVARDHSGYRLEVGSYRVLATAPGYAAVESRVIVRERATEQLDLGLVPLRRTGAG